MRPYLLSLAVGSAPWNRFLRLPFLALAVLTAAADSP